MELTALIVAAAETPAGRALAGGFRGLRFDDARLEREFRRVLRRQRLGMLTIALIGAIGIALLLAWLDWQRLPSDASRWSVGLRIVLMVLLPALAIVAAHGVALRDRLGLLVGVALLGLGIGTIATDALLRSHAVAGLPILPVVLLFGYLFLGIRFRRVLLVNVSLSCLQLLVVWQRGVGLDEWLDHLLLLGVANLVGAAGAYLLEHGWRTDYLKTLMINHLAERDGLTGAYNRRMFDHYIARIWREAVKDKALLVMMVVDVDHFRDFNDRYGLRAGDEALRRVADALRQAARRPLDFVARYTGLGFVIVLFNPDRAYAQELPQRAKEQVLALAIPHETSSVAGRLTVSIGVSLTVPTELQLIEDFVGLAERALEQAKERGRNGIVALEAEQSLVQTGMFAAELLAPPRSGSREPS